jgi:nucleoside-diphosphate-sugar epimerase
MLKKILLVGGTGYLGRHLLRQLEQEGSEVFITGTRDLQQESYFQINFRKNFAKPQFN